MIICLVTDRLRLAGPGTSFEAARALVVEQARRAAGAGVEMIQIRERDLEAAPLEALVTDVLEGTRTTRTRVVVNDRLDVALASGAGGVHLRSDSIPVVTARRLAPVGFTVGRSVHSVEEVVEAEGADYLVAGTVFPSASKPSATRWLGVDGLSAIVRRSRAPVLAIGGIGVDRIEAVAAAGAAGFAAIGFFGDGDAAASATRRIVDEVRRRFDSMKAAS